MEAQIITMSLRVQLVTRLKVQMTQFYKDRAECHDIYPSARILSKLNLDWLSDLSAAVAQFGSRHPSACLGALLTAEAQDYFERHAWNEFNALLLLSTAVERAWRLPMTKGDVRRALERLRAACPDQALLRRIQTDAFLGLSPEEMSRAKELGIVIDGLWCAWMESLEAINPIFLD